MLGLEKGKQKKAPKTFRVDRMGEVQLGEQMGSIDIGNKQKMTDAHRQLITQNRSFGMFLGKTQAIELRVHKSKVDSVIDEFGTSLSFEVDKELLDYGRVKVNVIPGPVFYSWVASFEGKISIDKSDAYLEKYTKFLIESARALKES